MFRHAGLDKQLGRTRIDPHGQPVDDIPPDALGNDARVFIVRGQGMPVGDKEKTFIFILQLEPVFQDPVVMPQMKLPRRAHAREHTLS